MDAQRRLVIGCHSHEVVQQVNHQECYDGPTWTTTLSLPGLPTVALLLPHITATFHLCPIPIESIAVFLLENRSGGGGGGGGGGRIVARRGKGGRHE